MMEELKNTYRGIRGWIQYVRDYKDNVDNDLISQHRLIDANREIDKLKKKLKNREELGREKDNLIKLREERIDQISTKLTQAKKDNATKQNIINILNDQLDEMTDKYNDTEKKRRLNAIEIGHRQRKINKLEKEIEKKDHMIAFLKASKHAPTKEEIIAYETRMREVERRQKNKPQE